MVSITSFVIVLLVASCYAAPIEKQPDSVKLNVKNPKELEFTKEPTNVPIHHKERSLKEKDSDSDELTTETVTRPPRVLESKESDEVTTPRGTVSLRELESKESDEVTTERINHPPRSLEGKDSDEMTTDSFTRPPREFEEKEKDEVTTERINRPVRISEGKDSDEITTTEDFTRPPRGLESDEMTTEGFTRPPRVFEGKDSDEVTTEVFTRPTRQSDGPIQSKPTGDDYKRTVEDFLFTTLESSTKFNQRAIRPVESQEEIESSSPIPSDKKKKSVDDEPSSVQTFGKSTGLLKDQTNKPINEDCLKESSDKICETKIDTKSPSKKSVVSEPVEQEQLSQVQHPTDIEKTKPDN